MWTNYHSHNKYCDGKGELTDHLTAARKQNVLSMGFSSHAPLPFDCPWPMKSESLKSYLAEIATLKSTNTDIEIYSGLEVDFIPGVTSPFNFKGQVDFTIGSVHFVDQLPDGRPWEIDNAHSIFQQGVENIFNNRVEDAIVRYFELSREMLFASTPDIIGHLDKIKIQNKNETRFSESDPWYKEQVVKLVDLIEEAGIIVEANTRGIYQKKSSTIYPSPWVLELLHKKKISVTISSDAHRPEDITNQFPETARLLYDIGFRTLSVLKDGQWTQLPFNANGIIIR